MRPPDQPALLPAGESAVEHAVRLILEGRTGGALAITEMSLFSARQVRFVVQHYPWEQEPQESLRLLAMEADCRFRTQTDAWGIALNEFDPELGVWDWDHPAAVTLVDTAPSLFAEVGARVPRLIQIVYTSPAGSDQPYRLELAPVVLHVLEHQDPGVLAELFQQWREHDRGWRKPVVLLTGEQSWGDECADAGLAAICNILLDADGVHVAVYSQGRSKGAFAGYAQFLIRVNEELWEFLPEG